MSEVNSNTASKLGNEIPARFLFNGQIGQLLLKWLIDDAGRARLSRKFRWYYRMRPLIPIVLRQMLQKGRNGSMPVPEDWYLPVQFTAQLRRCLRETPLQQATIHPWPDQNNMACVLTHDVETGEGLKGVLRLARLEEDYGFRSSWNLVPHKYPIDLGLLTELQNRGHEVAVHGFNHDGRLFESQSMFRSRSAPINLAIRRFGSLGFRSPMVHRNLEWMQALAIDYDSSCFDQDPFQAMPGGVGGVWPFFVGKFVELPYTLPQDHTLFVALQQESPDVWIEKYEWLRRISGMALLITHPDYLNTAKRFDVYKRFLDYLSEQEACWHALPREVATWWRQRDGMEILGEPSSARIVGSSAERARITTAGEFFGELLPEGAVA